MRAGARHEQRQVKDRVPAVPRATGALLAGIGAAALLVHRVRHCLAPDDTVQYDLQGAQHVEHAPSNTLTAVVVLRSSRAWAEASRQDLEIVTKNSGTAVTFTNGVDLTTPIGASLSSQTGFSAQAQIHSSM